MWFEQRLNKSDFDKQLCELKNNNPNLHVDDIFYYLEEKQANRFRHEIAFKKQGAYPSYYYEAIKFNIFDSLTKETILEFIENAYPDVFIDFYRFYGNQFDYSDLITVFTSAIKNTDFAKIAPLFIRICGEQDNSFADTFKDTLASLAFESHSKSALATYLTLYGHEGVDDTTIKNSLKNDISTLSIHLFYTDNEDLNRVKANLNQLNRDHLDESIKPHISGWYYTPYISHSDVCILNRFSRGQYYGVLDISNEILCLFEKINNRCLFPFVLGGKIQKSRKTI